MTSKRRGRKAPKLPRVAVPPPTKKIPDKREKLRKRDIEREATRNNAHIRDLCWPDGDHTF